MIEDRPTNIQIFGNVHCEFTFIGYLVYAIRLLIDAVRVAGMSEVYWKVVFYPR